MKAGSFQFTHMVGAEGARRISAHGGFKAMPRLALVSVKKA